jgi:hypothetical protein
MGIMKIYGIFAYYMSANDFHHFIAHDNQVGMLLQAHLIAVQMILDPVLKNEVPEGEHVGNKPCRPRHTGSVAWLETIDRRVTDEMRPFFEWSLERGRQYKAINMEKMASLSQGSGAVTPMSSS